ncbi:hypothetical protein NA57DRAFT_79775 [Rhizodiscina lignyota]|uniref:Carbohydrate esterase family 16 protein n=1 Tax=Rhizodiscina lignyota TaxID=1504668 RepID=A0A9P4I519_9PEZI|nr:hypothetical protein NA57DRAFT_79775 [Rhizodiscina lignyota]
MFHSWVPFLFLCGFVAAAPLTESLLDARASDTKYLFFFGDSYTKLGFSFSSNLPSAANPIGNPAFPATSSSGGENWVEFLTATYNRSLTLTYDIAVGGATVESSLIPPAVETVDLGGQLSTWEKDAEQHERTGAWDADNSLFLLWFAVNDVNQGFNLTSDQDSLYEQDMTIYFDHAISLYDRGAKNFVFLNCPPIHRSPVVRGYPSSDRSEEEAAETVFNSKLQDYVQRFRESHNVNAHLVDTVGPFNEALNNPKKYGAPDATCANTDGTSCLWFDHLHPGVAIQKLVAEKVASDVTTFFTT